MNKEPITRPFPANVFRLNDIMEYSKTGSNSNSSSNSSSKLGSSSSCIAPPCATKQYEAPLGYGIEDVRPDGGVDIFRSAAYSNCIRQPS